MLESPSWRSRHISIRGEAIRAAKLEGQVILTFVSTSNQLADPLTKPTGTQINQKLFPEWGLTRLGCVGGGIMKLVCLTCLHAGAYHQPLLTAHLSGCLMLLCKMMRYPTPCTQSNSAQDENGTPSNPALAANLRF
eukprot:330117-Amphidinium_carterae.2